MNNVTMHPSSIKWIAKKEILNAFIEQIEIGIAYKWCHMAADKVRTLKCVFDVSQNSQIGSWEYIRTTQGEFFVCDDLVLFFEDSPALCFVERILNKPNFLTIPLTTSGKLNLWLSRTF